ncbi:uncharacterized protein LOC116348452 [Contarinia nasturtii]|uniref:uncharacterized protein LOC116348452 n=1 Tax=Contarinia nasturtii TaxID=265458 RepID=UPI0012D3E374|nr:uncharacterized protein LOC116348452 [Contarinia nasturtii]
MAENIENSNSNSNEGSDLSVGREEIVENEEAFNIPKESIAERVIMWHNPTIDHDKLQIEENKSLIEKDHRYGKKPPNTLNREKNSIQNVDAQSGSGQNLNQDINNTSVQCSEDNSGEPSASGSNLNDGITITHGQNQASGEATCSNNNKIPEDSDIQFNQVSSSDDLAESDRLNVVSEDEEETRLKLNLKNDLLQHDIKIEKLKKRRRKIEYKLQLLNRKKGKKMKIDYN